MHKRWNIFNRIHLPYWIICVNTDEPTGSSNTEEPDTPSTDNDNKSNDTAKDFSHALAKRKAELEEKYADYDDIKKKLADYEAKEKNSKSDLEKLADRIAAVEKERDEALAREKRSQMVSSVAKETGLPAEAVAMLSADSEEDLKKAAETLKGILKPSHPSGPPAVPNKNSRALREDASARDLLRDAYSN